MLVGMKLISGIALGLVAVLAPAAPLLAAEPTINGFWEQVDDSGKVGGWFLMFERDGFYQGALVRAFPKPGDPVVQVCSKCTDEQKNAPMMGLIIIKGMQRKGTLYENGTILDPRDGSVYKAKMEVSPDGKNLTVRGFLGIELFGQSQVWRRLPDAAMARNEVPEGLQAYLPPPAPVPAPAKPRAANDANSKNPPVRRQ
jgi:hypothetical protein